MIGLRVSVSLILVGMCTQETLSAVAVKHLRSFPGFDGCVDFDDRIILLNGQRTQARKPTCGLTDCSRDQSGFKLTTRTCSPFAVGPECRIVDGDPKANFPNCCKQAKCDKVGGATLLDLVFQMGPQ